jgi:Domain of unknown function (DUF6468)
MTLTMILEITLEVLLAVTLGYCIVLERRLAAVRKGQEGLSRIVGELNMAISGAGASLRALKSAANEAAQILDERLKRARLHVDELSVLVSSAERIAQRIEDAASPRGRIEQGAGIAQSKSPEPAAQNLPLPSSSIMSRLDALRMSQ